MVIQPYLPELLQVLDWNFKSELFPLPSLAVLHRACFSLVELLNLVEPGCDNVDCVVVVVQCYRWRYSLTFVPGVDGQRAMYRPVTWWKLVPRGFFNVICPLIVERKQWLLTDLQTSPLIDDVTDLLPASAACVIIDWPFAFWHTLLILLPLLLPQRQLKPPPPINRMSMMIITIRLRIIPCSSLQILSRAHDERWMLHDPETINTIDVCASSCISVYVACCWVCERSAVCMCVCVSCSRCSPTLALSMYNGMFIQMFLLLSTSQAFSVLLSKKCLMCTTVKHSVSQGNTRLFFL